MFGRGSARQRRHECGAAARAAETASSSVKLMVNILQELGDTQETIEVSGNIEEADNGI